MINVTDQLGRVIILNKPPTRIISLVPSQTELLFYLGLDAEIVGITKYCTHPDNKVIYKPKIGGTKQLNVPMIKSLKPDLIVANKEENVHLQVAELIEGYPTYVSDPYDLPSALQMINGVGNLVGKRELAERLSESIRLQFDQIKPITRKLKVAYLIWRKPYMVAGEGTFINDMLSRCGFENVVTQQRYPEITIDLLKSKPVDLILLSTEPYPFKHKHVDELKALMPGVTVKLVDGEMFSWYGSRLLDAPKYFISLINSLKGL